LEAAPLGKYKTLFQMFALHGLLLHYRFFGVDFHAAGMYLLWLALGFSLWSGLDYFRHVFRCMGGRPTGTI